MIGINYGYELSESLVFNIGVQFNANLNFKVFSGVTEPDDPNVPYYFINRSEMGNKITRTRYFGIGHLNLGISYLFYDKCDRTRLFFNNNS